MPSFKTLLLACSLAVLPIASHAADTSALTDAQKKEVESVVRDLLSNKEPELIMKAAQVLQDRMQAEESSRAKEAVTKYKAKIYNDANSPVGGNPKGDVTVVEFFDYSCGYCKMGQQHVAKLLGEDKNIRFVYKELPILGPGSLTAAKAALASVPQGKYEKFHEAMMEAKEMLTEDSIMAIAQKIGIDTEKLKKEMSNPKIEEMIKDNVALAKALGANGTPTFVINDKVQAGALQLKQLKESVAEARAAAKK